MDSNETKSKTLTYPSMSSCRRRCCEDDERRDWASLPRDVLWVVLSKVPQADILRGGAALVCSPWRRLALYEPLLWRHIDLCGETHRWSGVFGHERPAAGWRAVARAAVDRSAGRCESFRGHADADVLVHLADRAPPLRSLYIAHWPYIRDKKLIAGIFRKLPLLERLVVWKGVFEEELLVALLDHCPRLELLHAQYCRSRFLYWEEEPFATRIKSSAIKDINMPLLYYSL
ncbi:unnamed protein product [Alopecurus aequalis]